MHPDPWKEKQGHCYVRVAEIAMACYTKITRSLNSRKSDVCFGGQVRDIAVYE